MSTGIAEQMVSPDGKYEWDGDQWNPTDRGSERMVSPDGKYEWDGVRWNSVAAPSQQPASTPPVQQPSPIQQPEPVPTPQPQVQQQPQPPQPKEYEFEGTVYRFSPNRSRESIEQWFDKKFADRRTLEPEQAGGRSLPIDAEKHTKLRQSTGLSEQGLAEYAELFSGEDEKGNPIVVKPEDVTPQLLKEVIEQRKALTEELAKTENVDPIWLGEFKEDTTAMERDLGRLWPNETTLEAKQRRAVARGDDPSKEKATPSPEARDEAILAKRGAKSEKPGLVDRILHTYSDTAITMAKGVVGAQQAITGVADMMPITSGIPGGRFIAAATDKVGIPLYGWSGWAQEKLGLDYEEAQQILHEAYSPETQEAYREVAEAKGLLGKIGAALQNPETILLSVGESLPTMVVGGAIGKLLQGAKSLGALSKYGYAVGEGLMSGGATAEQTRAQSPSGFLTEKQAAISAASGALTTVFGALGGKLAAKLEVGDWDKLMAGNISQAVKRNIIYRVVVGALIEGGVEETPQSVQEQIASNLANGKPWYEGWDQAAVMGALTGAVMGGGMNLATGGAAGLAEDRDKGSLQQLREILAKKFVTVEDGKALNFTEEQMKNRESRRKALNDLIQEIQHAEGTTREAETPSEEEGLEGKTGGQVPVWDAQQGGEGETEKVVAPPTGEEPTPPRKVPVGPAAEREPEGRAGVEQPPVEPGMVRFYHGGTETGTGGARWLSPDISYAEGYAAKSEGGQVSYVDIPEDSPLLTKAYDDSGTDQPAPFIAFEAPASIADNLRPVAPGTPVKPTEPEKAPEPVSSPETPPAAPREPGAVSERPDYESWTLEELVAERARRRLKLPGVKRKDILVSQLTKDDELHALTAKASDEVGKRGTEAPPVPAAPAEAEGVKESWQMMRDEYVGQQPARLQEAVGNSHKRDVLRAHAAGLPVPPEVLAEYGLTPAKAPPTEKTQPVSEAPAPEATTAEREAEAPSGENATERRLSEVSGVRPSANRPNTWTKKKPDAKLTKTEQRTMEIVGDGMDLTMGGRHVPVSNALVYSDEVDRLKVGEKKALYSLLDRGKLQVTKAGEGERIIPVSDAAKAPEAKETAVGETWPEPFAPIPAGVQVSWLNKNGETVVGEVVDRLVRSNKKVQVRSTHILTGETSRKVRGDPQTMAQEEVTIEHWPQQQPPVQEGPGTAAETGVSGEVSKPTARPDVEPQPGTAGAKERRAGPAATVPASPLPSGGKAPSTGKVVSAFSAAFGVPIRTGHFQGSPQERGAYKELEEVARIKGYGDIAVAAHEVAHHIDKTLDPLATLPPALQSELEALDYKPGRGDIHEGFAEYVRHRLTTDDAAAVAPGFDGWFTNWLGGNPAMADAFQAGRATVDQWRGAGAVERVKAQIHMGESAWKQVGRAIHPKNVWDWIANNWINRLRPLLKVAKEMTRAGSNADLLDRMPSDLNFWAFAKVSNISAAAKVRGWARFGTADVTGEKVGPGLKETFSPIADELQDPDVLLDFYAYTYSRHASTLYEQYDAALADWRSKGEVGPAPRLKQPGISRMDARATITEFDSKPGWEKAAQGLTSWHNDLIDYLVDAGGLSKEAADAMKAMYPNYISLARHMDSEFAPAAGGGGGRFANLPKGVRKLKGSGRQILPPLESALAYAERIIGLADKVRVSKMLIAASKKYDTLGDTVEKVDPKDVATSTRLGSLKRQLEDAGADLSNADMDALLTVFSQEFTGDAKDNILVLYENGEPQLYYVRPDLYRALMAVDNPARLPATIDQTFGRVARAIRLGTTGLKPGFSLATNPLRDFWMAMLQTEHQPRNPISIGLNAAYGLVEKITGSEVAQMWERGGGPMAQPLGIDRKFLKETIQELLAQSPKAKALNWAQHPVDSLRSLFSLPESAPRLAEYRAALYKMGWRPGKKVTFEQYVKAQLAGANVTVDFREGGTLGMWVNQITPFFNVAIQGPHRMASAIRSHPVATVSSAVLWLTLPTLALWWKQKDEEWYKSLTAMERYRYWHVQIPGTDIVLRLPKPFEWGHIFASMPEGAAQSMIDEDLEAVSEAAGAMLEDMTPSLIPGLMESPIEIAANKDFYFDRPLVSDRLKDLEAKDQYAPYTTEAAKAIGRLLGLSPIYVEHLASGWTGGLATGAVEALESVAGLGGKKTQRSITGGPATLPVVGRLFTSALHTRQFDDFYNRLETLEQKHASLKLRDKSDSSITMLKFMQDRSKDLAELRNESRGVLADESLSDNEKRNRFLNIHLKMVQMAEEANQMAHLDRPSTEAGLRKKWEEIHKEMSARVVSSASEPPPDPEKYKAREDDLRKAQKKYRETRELNKQRILAVATTHDEAQQLLLDYHNRPDRKAGDEFVEGTKDTLEEGYENKGIALAKLYGETDPIEAYKAFLAWRDQMLTANQAKSSGK